MKLVIDTDSQTLDQHIDDRVETIPLFSEEAFELISQQWLRVGWNQKYTYTFSWLGMPIIQLPEDLIRAQEAIFQVQPDVIIETGVAHGGSLVFYASLCRVMNQGRVIGVDVEIRPHNRTKIQNHPLSSLITLVDGDSVAKETVDQVRSLVAEHETALVFLDSCHTKEHVRKELDAYHSFVTPGSYIVATDGIMQDLYDVPRGTAEWRSDNPSAAAQEFLVSHPEFELQQPPWTFRESELKENVTHWPGAWLRRT